ncbi:unnamed protein product [Adineta steineri]|uniref:NHL repeat protein n=1 Tax=Adineta steineri TaxID=433720 RepID=A0A813MVX3_9BILA|nr:unnamed protein product [Adineta steineri]
MDTIAKLCENLTHSQIKENQIQTKKNKYQQFGITVAGGNACGQELNQLSLPLGMFIDNDKSIYVADTDNHRIVKWKLDSNEDQIIAGGNGQGNQNNQLSCPRNIIFDKKNNSFIISDYGNKRVIRYFDKNQKNQQILISNIDCHGLTVDKNGFIYVCDYGKNEVRRWKEGDEEGELVAGGNGHGNQLNQLSDPTFIFVDDDYSLYISDYGNDRVMKWKKRCKTRVIVDHLGQIYVADYCNNRVMRWCEGDEEGEIIVGGNGEGIQSNQLNYPNDLSFDNEENLYVADSLNNRIQKFEKIIN